MPEEPLDELGPEGPHGFVLLDRVAVRDDDRDGARRHVWFQRGHPLAYGAASNGQ